MISFRSQVASDGAGGKALSNHLPAHPGSDSDLRVAMALHIHKGKGTDVANPGHIHREVMEKIDNLQGARAKPEEQKQRGEEGGQHLLQEGDLGKQGEAEKGLLRVRRRDQDQEASGDSAQGRTLPTQSFPVLGIASPEPAVHALSQTPRGRTAPPGADPSWGPDPHRSVLQQTRHLPVSAGLARSARLVRQVMHVGQGRLQQELRGTALALLVRNERPGGRGRGSKGACG